MLNGTQAFSMGALAGGCRFVSGYPMTPGSPVLVWFAQNGAHYGAVAKHVEDEISAINMAIGAAVMGARTLVPTSGGGYALMVEATGFAGMSETPVVIYDAQRPGPATGLPTRTLQADLLFMLHAAQDEFPRMILAPGTMEEAFHLGWQAFNVAERYQTPVMVLSDQYLADAFRSLEADALDFDAVAIDRGALLTDADLDALTERYQRYQITESGISPRALPGHPNAIWVTESDEHDEYRRIVENAQNRIDQHSKRMRKAIPMAEDVPAPRGTVRKTPPLTLVCWGSTYGPAREAVDRLNAQEAGAANLLHFSGLEPFPPDGGSRAAQEPAGPSWSRATTPDRWSSSSAPGRGYRWMGTFAVSTGGLSAPSSSSPACRRHDMVTRDDYRIDEKPTWCSGCGDYGILNAPDLRPGRARHRAPRADDRDGHRLRQQAAPVHAGQRDAHPAWAALARSAGRQAGEPCHACRHRSRRWRRLRRGPGPFPPRRSPQSRASSSWCRTTSSTV